MRGFKYILFMLALIVSVSVRGQYNPTNPAEPGVPGVSYTLTLSMTPSGAGSFNINTVTSYTAGTNVTLRAYSNTGFSFVAWEENGEVISTSSTFTYTMPARYSNITARYQYSPSNPSEPSEPVMPEKPEYSTLTLVCNPASSGSFNISSGNSYQVGTSVSLRANSNSNFYFVNWTEDGEIISTSSQFNYVVKSGNPTVVANFKYNPSSPGEPSEPRLYHKLYVASNPSAGGYFNVSNGNEYQEGTSVNLIAYSNQYYKFLNWTDGETVISTSNNFNYIMPTHDAALTANYEYTFSYEPTNPGEPGRPSTTDINLYGMTENSIRGQKISYPVFLENYQPVNGVILDIQLPKGFTVHTDDITLSGRAAGHEMTVRELGDNAYRLSLLGETGFEGENGKLFDIPVSIPDTARMGYNYPVILTHGVLVNADKTQTPITVRSGYIYVEKISEDGLYAKFSFEKLLDRVKFTNLSSSKAKRYLWDFGDGETSTEVSPLHVFKDTGYHTVTLTAYGEYEEDMAETYVLINEVSGWKVGGTFRIGTDGDGARDFESIEDFVSFVSRGKVTEGMTLCFAAGKNYQYDVSGDNWNMLCKIVSELAEGNHVFIMQNEGEGSMPTLNIGDATEEPDSEMFELLNSLAPVASSNNIKVQICGVEYCPWKSRKMSAQSVNSGKATSEQDFSAIGSDLSFEWILTSATDAEAVTGYITSGTGNLPRMEIFNIDKGNWQFVYQVTVKYNDTKIYEFTHTITVNPENAFIDDDEWGILLDVHDMMVAAGCGDVWDMSKGKKFAASLQGVSIERGHIVAMDLSGMELKGNIPAAPLTLPRLISYNVSNNSLTGDVFSDIKEEIDVMLAKVPDFTSRLQTLDISGNKFTGDAGTLASVSDIFCNLTELRADSNYVSGISSFLPQTIETLSMTNQNTGTVAPVNFSGNWDDDIASILPSLMLYDHTEQCYNTKWKLRLTDHSPLAEGDDKSAWCIDVSMDNGRITVSNVNDNPYKGASGSPVFVYYPSASPEVADSYCLSNIVFSQGDVNFLGGVDAADLQATILYAFGAYRTNPFNFTAADTYKDGRINIQDVICTVNILLDSDTETTTEAKGKQREANVERDADAYLYLNDGKIILHSGIPVASLHIKAAGDVKWRIDKAGLEQSTSNGNVVAYSLDGATLSCNEDIVLGDYTHATILSFSLADSDAQPISTGIMLSPSGIEFVYDSTSTGPAAAYDISGCRLNSIKDGINIIRNNGTTRKIINRQLHK